MSALMKNTNWVLLLMWCCKYDIDNTRTYTIFWLPSRYLNTWINGFSYASCWSILRRRASCLFNKTQSFIYWKGHSLQNYFIFNNLIISDYFNLMIFDWKLHYQSQSFSSSSSSCSSSFSSLSNCWYPLSIL